MRSSNAAFQEFIKAAGNYQKQCLRMSEAGKLLADSIQKISQLQQSNDVGEAIQRLSDVLKNLETKREGVAKAIQDDLITSLQKSGKPEEAELVQFENDYKKARDSTRQQISKLEANSKKAGKKGGEGLKQAISQLNEKIKEADQIKADKLRNILLLERKKYCNFLSVWGPVISAEVDLVNEENKFKENEQYWKNLASSTQQLSAAAEDLIKAKQERTFVQIQSSEGSGDTSYDPFGGFDSPSYPSYNSGGSSRDLNSSGLGTATALYDFAGEQYEDLPFFAGEVLTITKEDDGSGWLTGDLRGKVGIFPSSYVRRN